MFIEPTPLPFPTPASILRRIYRLEARITAAETVARLRRQMLADERACEERAAAREANLALERKQRAERAAAREIERAAEAESLLRDRPLYVLLLQEGPGALLQLLESQPADAYPGPPASVLGPPSSSLHPSSFILHPLSARLHALEELLLHARHDIIVSRRHNLTIADARLFVSWGAMEPPGGPIAWREFLLYLQPFVLDQLNKNALTLVNPS